VQEKAAAEFLVDEMTNEALEVDFLGLSRPRKLGT